jgi:hypothetical protein
MFDLWKRTFVIGIGVFFCLGIFQGVALGVPISIDSVMDAGQYPGEAAYRKFVDKDTNAVLYNVSGTVPAWSSSQQVIDFSDSEGIENWLLLSAGNNSNVSPDTIVGYSLTALTAGTYRISVLDGAFEYDSFNWNDESGNDSQYYNKWLWGMHIRACDNANNICADYTLGSFTFYGSPGEALINNIGQFVDISVMDGGSLNFWINDWNSIDNSGRISFDVTSVPVPEPSMFLLLSLGCAFVVGRRNRNCGTKKS